MTRQFVSVMQDMSEIDVSPMERVYEVEAWDGTHGKWQWINEGEFLIGTDLLDVAMCVFNIWKDARGYFRKGHVVFTMTNKVSGTKCVMRVKA